MVCVVNVVNVPLNVVDKNEPPPDVPVLPLVPEVDVLELEVLVPEVPLVEDVP